MDYATAPLQALLVDHADGEQLGKYVDQLAQQFDFAEDETTRYGTLQLLIPVLEAYVQQGGAFHQQHATEVLRPIVLSTLAHNAMIATESLALVTKAACQFALASLVQDGHADKDKVATGAADDKKEQEMTFGHGLLRTLVGQLILVIDIEPDFVDLAPLDFIDELVAQKQLPFYADIKADVAKLKQTCQRRHKSRISMLKDDDDTSSDENDDDNDDGGSIATGFSFNTLSSMGAPKMTLQDFSQLGLLDLDACIDTLLQFVQDAIDSEATPNAALTAWIDLLLVIAIAMLPCTNMAVRNKLMNALVPLVLQWQLNNRPQDRTTHYDDACKLLWKRILQIYGLPATNLMRMETYGLIAKFFDLFFGLETTNLDATEPRIALDLRFDSDFFIILQSGLRSDDSLARKYASFLLKRVIDFCQKYPDCLPSSMEAWTAYFQWDAAAADQYEEVWDEWFLLYDLMHETEVHLVIPVLPRFEHLMAAQPALHTTWWTLLIFRGLNGEINNAQKYLWDYLLTRKEPDTLNKIAAQLDFFFTTLWKSIDNTSLFGVASLGTMVSPFGEHVKEFITNLVSSLEDATLKTKFIQQMIHHLCHVTSSHILILYTMEGLAECDAHACWGPEELKSLRHLVDRHRHFDTPSRRRFNRKLGTAAFVRFADPAALNFSDMAKTISSLITDVGVTVKDQEFNLIRTWLVETAAKTMSVQEMTQHLKDRISAYVEGDMDADIPAAVVQNQALVLTRTMLFFMADDAGVVSEDRVKSLLSTFSNKIQNDKMPVRTFNRLAILLAMLWEHVPQCFAPANGADASNTGAIDITELLAWSNDAYTTVLSRADAQLLTSDKDTVTEDVLVHVLLAITRRILSKQGDADNSTKNTILQRYHERILALLALDNKDMLANKELAKITHLRFLTLLYRLAAQWETDALPCDAAIMDILMKLPLKRIPELVRFRTWGDTTANFTRAKWEALESIVLYSVKIHGTGKQTFDPEHMFSMAIDELESASDAGAETIIDCMAALLQLPWEKQVNMVSMAVDYATTILREYINSSKMFPLLMGGIIRMIIQPAVLMQTDLNEDDGPVKKVMDTILEIGDWRPFIVHDTAKLLHAFWSTHTPAADASMLQYTKEIAKLLVFGPPRERSDQRLDAALYRKLASQDTLEESDGTAAMVLNQNDYVVRVLMTDLLLRLDPANSQQHAVAIGVLDQLLSMNSIDKEELYDVIYNNTARHRFKLRSWISMLLLHRSLDNEQAGIYIKRIVEILGKETNVSVRAYMEWMTVRLLLRYPNHLPILYELLENPGNKPSFAVSLLTITLPLAASIDESVAADYFNKIFVLLVPWLVPNHYTVRLYAYTCWTKSWRVCEERGFSHGLESNTIVHNLNRFLALHSDYTKMKDKVQDQYYLSQFDPLLDYNLEFIFREFPHTYNIAENERIGSRAFVRVNAAPIPDCPFSLPERQRLYTSSDPIEELVDDQSFNQADKDRLDESYQKKITPWEVMLQTDIDLTKSLVTEKKRRNDIIVVASLIDRVPNLAGLCRTCEIFNASLLIVHTLKVKDDPYFASISVSSEKWMPMAEVKAPDLDKFLLEKKQEGYVLCGMEQTTNSVKLGDYDFPDKCVLLLGKEKEGIPAHLLQLLDQAIEVPQYGVIRSLNVHVTGSICLYEYTKQIQRRQQQAAFAPPAPPS
ncbi:hypothetical protein BC940DRAFT_290184 [Gongronella butleri]|nr:hypothetical protein BC940DRAFT_290184 [Gongronella butleri]